MDATPDSLLPDTLPDAGSLGAESTLGVPTPAKHGQVKKVIEVEAESGETVTLTILRGRGKHQVNAQEVAGKNRHLIPIALVQQLVLFNGAKLTIEDWLETVDLDVLLTAQEHVLSGKEGKDVTQARTAGT